MSKSEVSAEMEINQTSNTARECIVVLGMHRSGTSAFMGALNTLGVNLGSNYLNPSEDNPSGFFENYDIVEINQKLLHHLNSSWDDILFLPDNWWDQKQLTTYKKEIIEVIERDFKGVDIFGIKDPRISRLVPMWDNIFDELSIKPYYIIPLRNPLEVAFSLKNRNGFSIEKSMLLWMNYMLNAEAYTRNSSRIFVQFDELIRSPEKTVENIFRILDIDFHNNYHKSKTGIKEFIEPQYKHHNLPYSCTSEEILPIFADYYEILLELASKGKIEDDKMISIDNIRNKFHKLTSLFYNKDVSEMIRNCQIYKKQLDETTKEKKIFKLSLEKIYQSNFWKIANKYYQLKLLPNTLFRTLQGSLTDYLELLLLSSENIFTKTSNYFRYRLSDQSTFPLVSILIVTFNNLEYTKSWS
jgi:hypothetical protein